MEKQNNLKIEKVWFDDENIYNLTNDGTQKSHPMRWFDRLWNATPEQRNRYEVGSWGDSISLSGIGRGFKSRRFLYLQQRRNRNTNERSVACVQPISSNKHHEVCRTS